LTLGLIHHGVEINTEILIYIEISPTVQAEWTDEEEVKSSFLSTICAQNIVVIIAR
jgi:hypothetical protein